jgi:hypothetical protein
VAVDTLVLIAKLDMSASHTQRNLNSIFDALVLGKPGTDGCKAAGNVAQAVLETIKENQ